MSFASIDRWQIGRHELTIKVKRKIVEHYIKNNINLEGDK